VERATKNPLNSGTASALMDRQLAVVATVLLLAGCLAPAPEQTEAEPTFILDADRPAPQAGDVMTGPSVGPDLNATTAAAPRLVRGEWWRIRFESSFFGDAPELVRVVANVTDNGYIIGMPHEGWVKEAISFHTPAFGDVGLDLSYNIHNEAFHPVRFPLVEGDTWETSFVGSPMVATVQSADEYVAEITFSAPRQSQPTDPVMAALGMSAGGVAVRVFYDARLHEIVRTESGLGAWQVIDHGYDFQGWVTVPRGEHTAIDYGTFGPVEPGRTSMTRTIPVDPGFNRMTILHMIGAMGPGSYQIRSVAPNGDEYLTSSTSGDMVMRLFEVYNPGGDWLQEDIVLGPGGTYNMGIAYHQYDIRLPDGAVRSDHAHPVIR
jgi:hypothetical protein